MSAKFDTYRKWLGIPPSEQPPDHYRLLGIGRFEDDLDTISNAADRQMAHVRTLQAGPHSALSQQLLNEIAAARLCLLSREKKAEYDTHLRARLAAAPQPAPRAGGPTSASVLAPAASPNFPRGTPTKSTSAIAVFVGGAILLAAVGVVLLAVHRSGEPGQEHPQRPLVGQFHPNSPTTDSSKQTGDVAPAANVKAVPAPALEILQVTWGKDDRWENITDRVRSLVHDERLVVTAWGSFFLGLHDPAFGERKQVRIDYRAAGERRTAQFYDGDFIYLDGYPPELRAPSTDGLRVLDARYGAGSTWIDVLPRVSRWVHGDRLAVRVNLVAPNDPAPGEKKALFLRYGTADGEFVAHAWSDEELVLDVRPLRSAGKRTDLIAAADPERDSGGAPWQKDAATLVAPAGQAGNLTIGTPFTEDYLLTAVVTGQQPPDNVGITLPVGERQVQLAIDGWSNRLSALQLIDGALGPDNPTARRGNVFEVGQQATVRCAVRRSGIFATCNGRVIADWKGNPLSLSPPDGTQAPRQSAIVVRGLGNPWRLTRLDVARLATGPSSAPWSRGTAVDLLKLIDVKLDAVTGDWEMTDKGLVSPGRENMRLGVPFLPADDYELHVVAEPMSGNDAFFIGLLVDGRQTTAILDGWGGKLRGLFGLDGENADHNATTREGRVFVDERPKELICTVHPRSVRITCDGQVLIDWHGDARRFSLPCGLPDELGLELGDWHTKYLISKLELQPLPPETPQPPTDLAQPVDVLERIDPRRDAVWGDWRKSENGLVAPGHPWQRLQLPVLPPEEYKLTIEAFGNRDITLGIVVGARRMAGGLVGGRQVEVVLDGGNNGDLSALELVNGKLCDPDNPTSYQGKVLRDDGPNHIVCTVRHDRVEVECNGRRVIDWQGDPRTLSLPHDGMMPDDRRPFLRCWEWPYRITRLELSAPDTQGQSPKPAARAERPPSLADLVDKPSGDKRLPVPTGADLAAADKKVSETFDRQWKAAKKFSDRLAVLRRLYDMGVAIADNPALRYALLREASRRAAEMGEASIACEAAEKLGLGFQIDALAEKLRLLSETLTKAHLAEQNWTIAIQALLLSDRASAEERFEEARKFASLAAAAGRRTRSHDVARYAEARQAEVRRRQAEQAQFEQALERLKEQPDDAAASETAGLHSCLVRGDWKRGLPLLARSGKDRLAQIARLEAEAGADRKQRAALVDAWLAEAEQRTGRLRAECQLQAKYWHERGLPAEAAAKAPLPAKLASLPAISRARLAPGLDMAMFDGGDFQQFRARRVEGQICQHFGLGSPDASVPGDYFSVRWTGWIKPPLPGKYVLKTNSDDSIRVRIKGQLVIDHWNRGAGDEVAEVELTDELLPLSVEYNDYEGGADVCLSWALKDFSDLQVVPAEALFHDPAVVP